MKFLGVLLLLILIAAGAVGFLVYAPDTPPGEVFIDLPTGTSSTEMAQRLQDGHVLRSRYAFLLLRVWKGGSLKAGSTALPTRQVPLPSTRASPGATCTPAP